MDYFYCDIIIITLQNEDIGLYINPNTEIALEWENLASHFSFVAVNANLTVANIRFTGDT